MRHCRIFNFQIVHVPITAFTSSLKPLIGFCQNFTGIIHWWSPTKVVQIVLIGCISRSRGQKVGFQNEIFKNLLV